MNIKDPNEFNFRQKGNNNANEMDSKELNQKVESQKRIVEEQRRGALRAILENNAIERLNRIALVKPEKVVQIEDYILRTARNQGFSPYRKMQEKELVDMISIMNEITEKNNSKIKIYRKGVFDDEDEEFYS
ncbi:double-stranded DNA-binding related protein [Cryptosporidium ubiquitum]|uniref:Double-stranded DNA-binding related protein n=1 Tax=Cryptosporidium ubiquitum TaxID=857276 RepID=A0A1J4MCT0_9CRYT|nr:double-stranded DNA-binding related protein [Cryptosporidium ubiquitum]OII72048.1 double-stranded DNA-binding related protein [Cryptosporidium ubiquitum]